MCDSRGYNVRMGGGGGMRGLGWGLAGRGKLNAVEWIIKRGRGPAPPLRPSPHQPSSLT